MNVMKLINKLNNEGLDRNIKELIKTCDQNCTFDIHNSPHSKNCNDQIKQILKQYHFLQHLSQKNKWRRLVKC
jgi:hypothetical protein